MPDERPAAERWRRRRPEDRRADLPQRRQFQLRRDVRQQDHSGLSVRSGYRGSFARALLTGAVVVAVAALLDGAAHLLLAQNPFGAPRPGAAEPQAGGIVGWLLTKQSEFY